MSKKNKRAKRPIPKTEIIQFSCDGRKYTLDVDAVEKITVMRNAMCKYSVSLYMQCSGFRSEPIYDPIKDFAEDAKALAAQYGLEIEEIKLKD